MNIITKIPDSAQRRFELNHYIHCYAKAAEWFISKKSELEQLEAKEAALASLAHECEMYNERNAEIDEATLKLLTVSKQELEKVKADLVGDARWFIARANELQDLGFGVNSKLYMEAKAYIN